MKTINAIRLPKSHERETNSWSFRTTFWATSGPLDTLSPLLFALFINDFNQYISTAYRGLNIVQSCYPSLNDEDIVLLKLFVLLYADDTIILAENEKELQLALDKVHQYCTMYKLSVNIAKSKIIVFSRGKVRRFSSFKYGFDVIEVVSDYVYLGITMNYNNKFDKAMKKQLDQGRKAQFSLLVKAKKMLLPIDIQCNLFEILVFPIMLYGYEIWGAQPLNMLEIFYRKFLKKILHLRPSTPSCMVYGEVGKLPLQVTVDKQLISYWLRLLNKDESTLAHIIYIMVLNLFVRDEYKVKWLCRVKNIIDSCGLSYLWFNQNKIDTKQSKQILHNRIADIALQNWYTEVFTSSMCTIYGRFKKQLDFENYLMSANPRERISMTKYRCANSRIPVYSQIYMYDTEACTLCNLKVTGDEYHYILICPYFRLNRELYIKPYYYRRPSMMKFEQLFSSKNKRTLSKLAKFITLIMKQF